MAHPYSPVFCCTGAPTPMTPANSSPDGETHFTETWAIRLLMGAIISAKRSRYGKLGPRVTPRLECKDLSQESQSVRNGIGLAVVGVFCPGCRSLCFNHICQRPIQSFRKPRRKFLVHCRCKSKELDRKRFFISLYLNPGLRSSNSYFPSFVPGTRANQIPISTKVLTPQLQRHDLIARLFDIRKMHDPPIFANVQKLIIFCEVWWQTPIPSNLWRGFHLLIDRHALATRYRERHVGVRLKVGVAGIISTQCVQQVVQPRFDMLFLVQWLN